MIKRYIEKVDLYLATLIIIAILTHLEWFSFSSMLFSWDWKMWPDDTIRTLFFGGQSTFVNFFNFGAQNIQVYFNIMYILWGAIGNYLYASKLIVLMPTALLSVISPYILIKYILVDKKSAFLGAMAFTFFTTLTYKELSHLLLALSFTMQPLLLLVYIKFLEKASKGNFLKFFALLNIVGFVEMRMMFVSFIIICMYTLFNLRVFFRIIKHRYGSLFLGVFISLLLHIFWILPLLYSGMEAVSSMAFRGLFGENFNNLLYSFTNSYYSWTGSSPTFFVKQPIHFYMWFVPIVVFAVLLLKKRIHYEIESKILFFSSLSLLGIFLTKQSAEPFIYVYKWLYMNFPGFSLFREPSKFFILTSIGYSFLFSLTCRYLFYNIKQQTGKIVLVIITFLLLINAYPLLNKSIGHIFVKRVMSRDYFLVNNLINKDKIFKRHIWIPKDSKWGTFSFLHPKVAMISVTKNEFAVFRKKEQYLKPQDKMMFILSREYFPFVLDASSISHVIVPIKDAINDDDLFIYYGGRDNPNIRQWYIDELDKLDYLEKIDIGTKELVVYENKDYKPYIRALDNLVRFENTQNLENKFLFVKDVLGNEFDFIIGDKNDNNINSVNVKDIFENVERKNLGKSTLVINDLINNNSILYARKNEDNVIKIENNKLEILNTPSNEIIKNIDDTLNDKSRFIKTSLASLGDSYSVEYKNDQYNFNNLITNSSFEDGLWSEKVGDCNNNGSSAVLGMIQSNKASDGSNSLELQATQHIACTSQNNILVEEGERYLLAFDYQSDNAEKAGYYISFDNAERTKVSERLLINDNKWHTFEKQIVAPKGAKKVSLYVYSYASDGKENIITRYDNFYLTKLPDVMDRYYVVNKPVREFVKPKSVEFDLINPTKKIVHIKGATTPLYLTMSESYHDKWQAQLNNKKVNGFFKKWVPFVHPDSIQNEQHFKYMTFLNGWYVDPQELCRTEDGGLQNGCVKNSDGSYDMEMVIEFIPQRWFYLGLLISGVTFFSLIGYLGYDFVRRRKKANKLEL